MFAAFYEQQMRRPTYEPPPPQRLGGGETRTWWGRCGQCGSEFRSRTELTLHERIARHVRNVHGNQALHDNPLPEPSGGDA